MTKPAFMTTAAGQPGPLKSVKKEDVDQLINRVVAGEPSVDIIDEVTTTSMIATRPKPMKKKKIDRVLLGR